jgi:hypothetical protein
MLNKTSFPKLRPFYGISNNGIQSIHTNNIAISMRIKLQRFFKHFKSKFRKKYYRTLYFPLSLTSENKIKKQKDVIAESKGNNFEHSPATKRLSNHKM